MERTPKEIEELILQFNMARMFLAEEEEEEEEEDTPNIVVSLRDITERKQAEEKLKLYGEIFLNSNEGIAIIDPQGFYLEQNSSHRALIGYSSEELEGKTPALHLGDETFSSIQKEISEKGMYRGEVISQTKSGRKIDIELSAFPIFNEKGEIICYVGIKRDITERKRMEEVLQISAQQWRATFDAISDAVCLLDLEGRILRCNTATSNLLGKPFSRIIGKTYWELIHGTSKLIDGSPFMRMRKTKRREVLALPMRGRWFNITADPLLDEAGKLIGGIHIIRDITKRKQAEEELKSSREQLRNLSAHLQSVREEEGKHIAREIHDELGQALTALKMDISWLNHRLTKDQKSLFEKTESMSRLVDMTIQTVQRILTELRPGLLDDLGLAVAIEWQAEEFQKRTGIKCEISSAPKDIILDQDRSTAIFRIFQETLTNVARHANATRVKVSLKEKAGKSELKVKDNGRGITKEQISDNRSFGLIGIRERVYLFGGEVKISGIRNKGTTLTVTIPLETK